MSSPTLSLLRLLQITDSSFPVGGYAYSHGLEWLVANGRVSDEAAVEAVTDSLVAQTLRRQWLTAAARALRARDLRTILAADEALDASIAAAAEREAGRATGTRLLEVFATNTTGAWTAHLHGAVLSKDTPGQFAVAFAVAGRDSGAAEEDVLAALAYSLVNSIPQAAIRLGAIGPAAAARIVAAAAPAIADAVQAVSSRSSPANRSIQPDAGNRGDAPAHTPLQDVRVMTAVHVHNSPQRTSRTTPIDARGFVRIGIAGPVGSGKTATMLALCRQLRDTMSLAVVTNDIYTHEDAEFLLRESALSEDRIVGVATGGCPHSAIREDSSLNLRAIDDLADRHPDLELLLIESGGDNLAATFSPELVDRTIFVIDVAGGDKIPRKGGPGTTNSDLLVINKKDLAPHVGASLAVMERDTRAARGHRPFLVTEMRDPRDQALVAAWVLEQVAEVRG